MLNSLRAAALAGALTLSGNALAGGYDLTYEVTITNITRGQTFTPQLVTTHNTRVALFDLGEPASDALEVLAEDGGTGPLTDELLGAGYAVADVETNGALLPPGESVTVTVTASRFHRRLSFAAMLIPTNDTFVAIDSMRLPFFGSRTRLAKAYDAGTEPNDQNCANMPGPRCGGVGLSAAPEEGDEGYVYISNGFHDLGREDAEGNEILGPAVYDWRNPVAEVRVTRVR
ncbi:MAG: spondin domain-containing protein [Pseudomonadota bacterium]